MASPDYWRRLRLLPVALTVTAVAACNDMPLEQQVKAPNKQLSATSGPPALHSNSSHYREQTVPHAKGRSGSATLTARALLGKDGQTLVELTTGQLDASGAPGEISKVQLKFFHPATTEKAEPTQNFNGLSGSGNWSKSFGDHIRKQVMQAQANVRGIDPKRTDVVTVSEPVKLRPDVAVTSLDAPGQAGVGTLVNILSNITELNGDVGATTNCVLYVNGVEADRANGVWVANGDVVTCGFAKRFNNPGTYNLRVVAESVVPGDWDAANNVKTGTIEVTNPILHGYAHANDNRQDYSSYNYGYNWGNDYWSSWMQSWSNRYDNNYQSQYAYFYGYTPSQFSGDFNVSAQIASNGWTFDGEWASAFGGQQCAYSFQPGFNLSACSYPWGSTVTAERWASWSYYYSGRSYYEYYCNYYGGYCGYPNTYYYSNGPYYNSNGRWFAYLGSDVSWHVQVSSANGNFTGDVTVPLVDNYNYRYEQPYSCYNSWAYYSCSWYLNSYSQRSGWANF